MNVLLIYPEFPDTFWSFKHAVTLAGKKANMPPLGLFTVAAMLPPAWQKRLIDVNVEPLTEQDLAWADCAFVGATVVQEKSARQIVERCHAAGIRVVAGGPLFLLAQDRFENVDHFVLNEAELTLPVFLADLAQGRARRVYDTTQYADIHLTPAPSWHLADLDRYLCMSIQFSRGCPYNCDFCNVAALLGHQPRNKTSAQILAELDGLYTLGWRGMVLFVDDNLIGNKQALKGDLLPALIRWRQDKKGMILSTQASINLADDEELMRLMVEAGFTTVFVGIETPDDDCLAECNKKHNTRRNLLADVRRLQSAGLRVQGGFIVGFDHDTPSCFQRNVDFIQASGIVTAMVSLLQAMPGTRLYERLEKEHRLVGQFAGDNGDGTTNIVPRMDLEVLRAGYTAMVRQL